MGGGWLSGGTLLPTECESISGTAHTGKKGKKGEGERKGEKMGAEEKERKKDGWEEEGGREEGRRQRRVAGGVRGRGARDWKVR